MPEMLTFGFVDDVYNNLAYLKEHMPNKENIVFPNTPQTGDGNGIPVFTVGSILNTIESCIDVLMTALNTLSADIDGYRAAAQQDYGSAFEWSGTVSNMTERISRWLSWTRNVYAYLEIEDESQSTITENENQIIVTVIDQADDVGAAIYIFDDEEGE